jgi:hypothetical protein
LPEDEQTSKHGGGGRYNIILEFKRGANKKIDEEEKEKKSEHKEKNEKRKNMSMYNIKII